MWWYKMVDPQKSTAGIAECNVINSWSDVDVYARVEKVVNTSPNMF